MSGYIDLHLHSTYSDGALKPDRLLEIAREKKLAAFSITDHDTLEGYWETKKLLQENDPELVPGVELSVAVGEDDLHMLAYLFDAGDERLNESLEEFQEIRNRRGRLMVQKLNVLGLDISFEAVEKAAGGSVVGRPHIAEAMLELGLVSNFEESFRKYIGNDRPAYVPKSMLKPAEAIKLVHNAGGVAVLAHPFIGGMHRHVEMLAAVGLDGIEVYHYSHKRHHVIELKNLAGHYGLLKTGGSDFHGRHEHEGEVGVPHVSADILDKLKQRSYQIRGII